LQRILKFIYLAQQTLWFMWKMPRNETICHDFKRVLIFKRTRLNKNAITSEKIPMKRICSHKGDVKIETFRKDLIKQCILYLHSNKKRTVKFKKKTETKIDIFDTYTCFSLHIPICVTFWKKWCTVIVIPEMRLVVYVEFLSWYFFAWTKRIIYICKEIISVNHYEHIYEHVCTDDEKYIIVRLKWFHVRGRLYILFVVVVVVMVEVQSNFPK
jgi:hypothetical protein